MPFINAKTIVTFLRKLFGFLLLVLPFVFLPDIFGPIKGYSIILTPRFWLFGIAIVFISSWFICLFAQEKIESLYDGIFSFLKSERNFFLALCFLVLSGLLVFFQSSVFNFRPHNVDSIALMFQARIFASARFVLPSFDYPEFFTTLNTINDSGGWYSQYPPGHAAVLALGLLFKLQAYVPFFLSLGSVFLFYKFVKNIFDVQTAQLSLLLTLVCPFFLFMGVSYMNHVTALFFIMGAYYFFSIWDKSLQSRYIFLSGLMFAGVFLSRPLDACALGFPLAVVALFKAINEKCVGKTIIVGLLGFLPLASFLLIYNHFTTGNAFLTGYTKLWGAEHGLGFHVTPWGLQHSPFTGLRNQLADLSLIQEFLFESPIPSLMFLACFLLFSRKLIRWEKILLCSFCMLPFLYFFYWHRDAYLGPRFLYSGVFFLIALTARALIWIHLELKSSDFKIPKLFSPVKLSSLGISAFFLSTFFSIISGIPQRYNIYSGSYKSMKIDLTSLVHSSGVKEGLVFLPVSWGTRIISSMRGLGVSPSLIEHSYSSVDHCLLDNLVKKAQKESKSTDIIEDELKALIAQGQNVIRVKLTEDKSLRLRKNVPLTAECIDEIRYDEQGFTTYTPALQESLPEPSSKLIFARDMRDRNSLLLNYFSNKKTYILREGILKELLL